MNVAGRLAVWGIVEVIGDYNQAKIESTVVFTNTGRVQHHKTRPSFMTDCVDCGSSPHVSPDDVTVAVCLKCGRDRWL